MSSHKTATVLAWVKVARTLNSTSIPKVPSTAMRPWKALWEAGLCASADSGVGVGYACSSSDQAKKLTLAPTLCL